MANKIKDTDYLAISARVRAMETTLLTAERMERLLEARSDEEVSKLLQDCGYPELDAARPEAMDAALSQAREELLTDLGDGAPDPRYIDIFKLKYDYHNAKAILKAAAMGTSPDRMLMDMGRIGAAELKTAVESGELDKLPHKVVLDVEAIAKEVGSVRAANIVMLGAAAPFIGIEYDKIADGIRRIFGRKGEEIVEMNLKALKAGYDVAQSMQ